jgi:hypothetical protein
MGLAFEIVGSLITICGLSVFAYIYFGGRRRTDEERGLRPVYTEQCGGRFDGWGLTTPFVRLAIYDHFLVVAYGSTRHLLWSGDIKGVSMKWYPLSKSLQINHSRTDLPQSFVIRSRRPENIIEAIYKNRTSPAGM